LLASSRHDFEDLPVFVIDEPSASELDDGISIELPPTKDGLYWIHVHIADPTVYIHPNHTLAKQAEKLVESRYWLQRTNPVFPTQLIQATHLGSDIDPAHGLNVMTFSAFVDPQGDISDYRVRAGKVRKVHVLPYDGVDAGMGFEASQPSFPLGGSAPPTPEFTLSESHKPYLSGLAEVVRRVKGRRSRDGIFEVAKPILGVRVSPTQLPLNPPRLTQPLLYSGFPSMEYQVSDHIFFSAGSRGMVSECAKLAGEVASRWFRDNNVPALRRVMDPFESSIPGAVDNLHLQRDKAGFVEETILKRAAIIFPTTELSTELKGHALLGIKDGNGYCRVTSPLRRYIDLLHHWQIKHKLLGGTVDTFPFTKQDLRERALPYQLSEKECSLYQKRQMKYWALRILRDRLERRREQGIEDTFPCTVYGTVVWDGVNRRFKLQVLAKTLAIQGFLSQNHPSCPEIGTVIQAKVKNIELGLNSFVEFEPV
jgi:hypothetical protein